MKRATQILAADNKMAASSSQTHSSSQTQEDGYFFSLQNKTPHISNQKDDPWCLALVLADMIGTLYKMCYDIEDDVVLSPQPLIDAGISSVEEIQEFCIYNMGLEKIQTYPFIRVERPLHMWSKDDYKSRKHMRYTLDQIEYIEDEKKIQEYLSKNFREGGKNYPLLGALNMGDFADNEVSAIAAIETNPPYLPPHRVGKERKEGVHVPKKRKTRRLYTTKPKKKAVEEHAVLIVGINTNSIKLEQRYCQVKNTAGIRWGAEGFSRVGITAFNYIMVPVYEPRHGSEKASLQIKSLEKETDESILRTCFLVQELGLYTRDEDIENYFSEYGQVEQVEFIIRKNRSFTRCCIVKMESQEAVHMILTQKDHKINRYEVSIVEFRGMTMHQQVYLKGKFKLIVKGYKEDVMTKAVYEFLEQLFHNCHFRSIELPKHNYKRIKEAKIRFLTSEARAEAVEKAARACLMAEPI